VVPHNEVTTKQSSETQMGNPPWFIQWGWLLLCLGVIALILWVTIRR